MSSFIHQLQDIVGKEHVLDKEQARAYLTDWRGRFTGNALAVVRPKDTQEVAKIVQLCRSFSVPIVTQGGNTGLCGGATPSQAGNELLLLTTRMNHILAIDPDNNTITVQAGCLLQQVQEAARAVDRLFPLRLASEGSCTIGGNLATNAGGTQVLRYGNMRSLCLGVEVVTAEGKIWNGLRGLRKDNSAYSLRDLFIGSEGTLGIITAATLSLYPLPLGQETALLAFNEFGKTLKVFNRLRQTLGDSLTGFELMSSYCIESVRTQFPDVVIPFSENTAPWYALVELADHEGAHTKERLETLLSVALEQGLLEDVMMANSTQQSAKLWHIRESIPLAEAKIGKGIKHDISLPISSIENFITTTNAALQDFLPGSQAIIFGHLGDGNLHYNLGAPKGQEENFLAHQEAVYRIVFEHVRAFQGSIAAEHGVGQLKRDYLVDYKDTLELDLMRSLKKALDPSGLFNPEKVLAS